jgi:hypothetical protein
VNQQPIMMGTNGTPPTSSTYYMGPGIAPVPAASTFSLTVSGVVPVAGTIVAMYAASNGNIVGTGATDTVTVIKNDGNGTQPTMTCQLTPSVSACSSTSSFTVAASDTISCSETPANVTTARAVSCGFVWQPNTAGQALVFGNGRAVLPVANATNADYYGVAGPSAPGSHLAETVTQQLSPTLPSGGHTLTFGNLYVAQSGTPATNGSGRATTLRAAGGSVGPHCTIGLTSGTIGGATAYFCSDTASGDNYSAASGTLIDMQTNDPGTSGGATLTWFKSTMTAVYQ